MDASYYIRLRNKVSGPYTLDVLQQLAAGGQFSRMHQVSLDGVHWQNSNAFPGIFSDGNVIVDQAANGSKDTETQVKSDTDAGATLNSQPVVPPLPPVAKGVDSPLPGVPPAKLNEHSQPRPPLRAKAIATKEMPPPSPRSMRKLYAILGAFLTLVIAVGCCYFIYDTTVRQRERKLAIAEQAEHERQELLANVAESKQRLDQFKKNREAAQKEFEPFPKPPAEISNAARLEIANAEKAIVDPVSVTPLNPASPTMQQFGHAVWQLEQLKQANNDIADFNATKAKEFAEVQEVAEMPNSYSIEPIRKNWIRAGYILDDLNKLNSRNARITKDFESAAKAEQSWSNVLAELTEDSESTTIREHLATAGVQEKAAQFSLTNAQIGTEKLGKEEAEMKALSKTAASCLSNVDAGYTAIIAAKEKAVSALRRANGKYDHAVNKVRDLRRQSAEQFIAGFSDYVPLWIEANEGVESKLNNQPLIKCRLALDIAVSNPAIIETRKTQNGWGIVGKKNEGDDIPVALFRLEEGDLYFSWKTSEPKYRNALLYSRMKLTATPEAYRDSPDPVTTKHVQLFAPAAVKPIELSLRSGEFASGEVKRDFYLPDFQELFPNGKIEMSDLTGCDGCFCEGQRTWGSAIPENTKPKLMTTHSTLVSPYKSLGVARLAFQFKSQYPSLEETQPAYSGPKETDTSLESLKARWETGNNTMEAVHGRIIKLKKTIIDFNKLMKTATSSDAKKRGREALEHLEKNLSVLEAEMRALNDFQQHLLSVAKLWTAIDATAQFQVVLRVPAPEDMKTKEQIFILARTFSAAK